MQLYCHSLTRYQRLKTREVKIGGLVLGNLHPVLVQTMTTTDTMDTKATVEQSIRCIRAGADMVRITAPSRKEAENLQHIKDELRKRGYSTPLVADIHFTPNAAEIAARIVEKVRINPGNYIDKKKFEFIEYSDADYREEMDRIRERFTPLVRICREYGTAMRIGTNHGSLSDRIMSRYGDTPVGMVESAMEFLRVARDESFHQVVLSMKSSNPLVMVQAYRLLVRHMLEEFGECYPLHLGVTEAGDGEDGRIKSAIGIGTLMEDGLGDTIRVSLTEDPEYEIPVCRDLVRRYQSQAAESAKAPQEHAPAVKVPYDPYSYRRRESREVTNMGARHLPVVVADFMHARTISREDLRALGYHYDSINDKWHILDAAADYIYSGNKAVEFPLPGTLRVICNYSKWLETGDHSTHFPLFQGREYLVAGELSGEMNFVALDTEDKDIWSVLEAIRQDHHLVLCLYSSHAHPVLAVRRLFMEMIDKKIICPVILVIESRLQTIDEQLIHFSAEAGALLLDGFGDGLWLINDEDQIINNRSAGRTYLEVKNNFQFLNNSAFSILQATRTRISKTEYISCPSCGRTLFDLQETTARIRAVTHHLKGIKIAIMGCIVNGPGEMADADYGYVGSGPGKITLYKGKEIVQRGVNSDIAVEALIQLIKENDEWIEPGT